MSEPIRTLPPAPAAPAVASRRRIPVLNAFVHEITMDELVEEFEAGVILTLHVDMVMKMQRDRDFHALLERVDVVTCDSQIMAFCTRFLGDPVPERVSGSDFFGRFVEHHRDDPAMTLFILGGAPGVADLAAARIDARAGRRFVVGTAAPEPGFENDAPALAAVVQAVNASGARAVMVGLGGGRQEKFIFDHRAAMPGVRLWLPLGGTIDYESGTFARPPGWVTDAGLEWAYRLIRQPRTRFRRYVIENPPFLWHVLRQKLGLYRDPLGGA